jgi:hypothetical protein
VQDFNSPGALDEICRAFAHEARRIAFAIDNSTGSARDANSESSFATLAATFINSLSLGPPSDLGKNWLLHRLHCVLVNHEIPKAGEIEVMRADIHARVEASTFASGDAAFLMNGIDEVLRGFALWPNSERDQVRLAGLGREISP